MITKEQFQQAIEQRDAAEKVINEYTKQSRDAFAARWERFDKHNEYFTDSDLIYSATSRCKKCEAGLAYPKGCDPWHQWTCSGVLKGIGTDKGHTALPFSMYEVLSEQQPSANGETTRPNSMTTQTACGLLERLKPHAVT